MKEEAGGVAFARRVLGDETRRKLVVEVGGLHDGSRIGYPAPPGPGRLR